MTTRSLLIVGALTLSSLGIANAKSFDVILGAPAMAGNTQLKAGEYKLKVEGTQATFTESQTSKSVTVPVKIENGDHKFGQTSVETSNQNGMDNIQAIDLAGSNTKLEFGK
jgi:phosphoribosylformylglycinamidine (FGAM) synthase-like amidotransferase family enzyme